VTITAKRARFDIGAAVCGVAGPHRGLRAAEPDGGLDGWSDNDVEILQEGQPKISADFWGVSGGGLGL